MGFGTHQTSDTLLAYERSQNLSLTDFGEDNAYAAIQEMLAAHNAITSDLRADFCMNTTERLHVSGAVTTLVMEDADEYTTPDAQKVTAGANLGIPLNLVVAGAQWTRKYLQTARLSDLNATAQAIMTADLRRVSRDLRRAFMLSTNYTATDKLFDRMALPVKRLYNADSFPIPADPWGATFDVSTHTHYLATASFVVADLASLINTVLEHNANASMRVYINAAQEATVRAFTGFAAVVDTRVVQANTSTYVANTGLDMTNTQDRMIGLYGSAEIWVKPWVPASYLVAHDVTKKPLLYRTRAGGSGNLEMVADDEAYPLRAKVWEREFGIGVYDRSAMAVLYTGSGTYADPTIT